MRSPRAVILLTALLALLLVGGAAVQRARSRTTAAVKERRPSPWVVPRAGRPPRFLAPPAPGAVPANPARANLIVRVEDVEGGAIPGARVAFGERALGATDEAGLLRLDSAALGLADRGTLRVRADGYGALDQSYAVPDEVRFRLIVGSVLRGQVVRAGTEVGVAGLQVTAGDLSATSDQTGHFTIKDLPADLVRVRARGEGWYGELAHPVAMGPGRTVEVRIAVARAFTIRGRVLQEGRPITGEARVRGGGADSRTSGGRFALVGVAPGTYALEALREPAASYFTFGPSTTVAVIDRDVDADVDLGARHGLVIEAVDGGGRPLARVPFTVMESRGGDLTEMSFETDETGRCVVGGLRPGPIRVGLTQPPAETRTVSIPATGPARFVLSGRGSIAGRLVCADGRPPSRRQLYLAGAQRERAWTSSASDGSFRFPLLGAGDFTLSVDRPAEATRTLALGPGEVRTDVIITLPAETAHLEGRVLDAAGAAVPDALVSQRPFDASMVYGGGFDRGDDQSTTDATGRFRFEGLVPGRQYTLVAYRITGESATLTGVPTGAPVVLRLEARASLRVRAHGGEAAATFTTVTVQDGQKVLNFAIQDQAGPPLQVDGLPAGTWQVHAQRGAYQASARAAFEPGKTTELELALHAKDGAE